jgi:hypothetical protein
MNQQIIDIEKRIDDLYRAVDVSQNTVIWTFIIFVITIFLFVIIDIIRRREIEGYLNKSRATLKKLNAEAEEIEFFKPIIFKSFTEILLNFELYIKLSDIPSDRKRILQKDIVLLYEHLKLLSGEKAQIIQSLHRLHVDGEMDSLFFLESLEKQLNKKPSLEKKDFLEVEELLISVQEEIKFKHWKETKK